MPSLRQLTYSKRRVLTVMVRRLPLRARSSRRRSPGLLKLSDNLLDGHFAGGLTIDGGDLVIGLERPASEAGESGMTALILN